MPGARLGANLSHLLSPGGAGSGWVSPGGAGPLASGELMPFLGLRSLQKDGHILRACVRLFPEQIPPSIPRWWRRTQS